MMTKEEVASIVKYCNDNGVSYKARLSELGVPEHKDGVLSLNCWAHTQRSFDRSMSNDAERSKYAIGQIGLLYEVERKAINYAIVHYDSLCRYVIDGRYRIDTNLVENGQRPVALTRKNYLFCKNHDAPEDAAVMYTIMAAANLPESMSKHG